jgi:hypothetical protein
MKSYLCLVLLALVVIGTVYGQGGMGSITGTVVDKTDAPIPNAEIRIVQISTNSERLVTTNEYGIFTLPSLPASKYEISISAKGFQSKTIRDLELNALQALSLGRLMLEIGSAPATTVVVNVELPKIMTESAVRGDTVQAKQVTEMPLQGRNW